MRYAHCTARAVPLACLLAAGTASAQNEPLFSVANGGPSNLPGDAVFQTVGGVPTIIGGGPGMGLGRPGDEIQGLAPVVIPTARATQDFVICFSVDPFSVGISRLRIPTHNVFTQSANRQQAGDAFLSTEAMRRDVGVLPPPFSMGLENNALGVNQSEEYPNSFGLLPDADPDVELPPDTPLDRVDASVSFTDFSPPSVYFTLSGQSPSHPFLPGPDSGATIFFDPHFQQGGNEQVYAAPFELGLLPNDEIDGMIVLDDNLDGRHNGTDTVYFSLARGSPTLALLGLSPADMLVSAEGVVALFVPAPIFGLLSTDNMTAMDMVPLINDSAEDTINSMVDCPADFNDDGKVNTLDVLAFLNAWAAHDPRADFNEDGVINTLDVLDFLNQWAGGC